MAPPRKTAALAAAAVLVLALSAEAAAQSSRTSRNSASTASKSGTHSKGTRNPPAAQCPRLTGVPGCSACIGKKGKTPAVCTACSGAAYESSPVNGVCRCADGYGRPPFPAPPAVAHNKGGKGNKHNPRPPRGRQPCVPCPANTVSTEDDKCVYCPPTFIVDNNQCVCPDGWLEINGVCEDQSNIQGVCDDPNNNNQPYDGTTSQETSPGSGVFECVCIEGFYNLVNGKPECTECVLGSGNSGTMNTGCSCTSGTWDPVRDI